MKVAFISRASLFSDRGGDTIQMQQTAEKLRLLGTVVDIFLTDQKPDYDLYDLLHFFNIIRPDDILPHISVTEKPFVVSTIFVDYSEYEKKARKGLSRLFFKHLRPDLIEYAKVLARFVLNGEKLKSRFYLLNGHSKSIRRVIQEASSLLPNSKSEYERLVHAYGIEKNYSVIPNGINESLFVQQPTDSQRDSRLILCVARIEGRKNQLNLIRALAGTPYKLILIGAMSTNQVAYYEECKAAASSNVEFIDFIEQKELLHYYSRAQVHVLPSWFETTGLSSLEAAAMGCNIVITRKGDTYEYFGEDGYYCDPESPESILIAIEQAATHPARPGLAARIRAEFTWSIAAKKTNEVYKRMLPAIQE